MSRAVRAVMVAAVGLMALPAFVAGQDAPPPQPGQQTELAFEREVFQYPQFQRRNPFAPLDAGDAGAVRFEQLRVGGILFSEDATESVVILSTAALTVSEDGTGVQVGEGESWYAKVGQTVGNVRILEIRQDAVLVEVEVFGIAEQRLMQLQTRRLGGTS